MASISPFQDYELTSSLEELERLYYETKKEIDQLKDTLKYREERLSAILGRMDSIVSEKEEYEINYSNFNTSPRHAGMIDFAEKHLGTRDKKKVIEFVLNTLGYPEKDSRYTKQYWISEVKRLGGNPVEVSLKVGDRIKHKENPDLEYVIDKVTLDAIYCSCVSGGKAVLGWEGMEKYEIINKKEE